MLSSILKNLLHKFKNNEKFRLLACAISGILSSLPYFFDWLFPLAWFSFVPLFLLFIAKKETTLKKAFLYGFLHHFIKSVIVLSWFKELYSMDVVDLPPFLMIVVIFFADVVLSALQSLPFGVFGMLAALIIKHGKFSIANSFSVSVLFTLTELFNTIIEKTNFLGLVGFPWVVTYITQHSFTCGIQSSSLFGAHFITLIIVFINVLFAYALVSVRKQRTLCLICALSVFAGNVVFGISALIINTGNHSESIKVAAYQDNNSSVTKWFVSSDDICETFIEDLNEYCVSNQAPDIIVMSETVFTIPNFPNSDIASDLADITDKYDVTIICGGFRYDDEGEYNSLFMLEDGKIHETMYDKRTLVPFGEYMPAEDILLKIVPVMESFNLGENSILPGKSSNIFVSDRAKIGGLICYDSIFSYNAAESTRDGAQLLSLSTNDSWYNDSAAIYQHYAHSKFRAIENRRCVIRSATTGVSGVIDSCGRTLNKSELFEKTFVDADIYLNDKLTLFSRFEYTYLYILSVLSVIYLLSCIYCTKKQKCKE